MAEQVWSLETPSDWDQQRLWLVPVSKITTEPEIATMEMIKLNAQVTIRNLQNVHEMPLPPTVARRRTELEYRDWARKARRPPTS